MSKDIQITNKYYLTESFGGHENGKMLQLTIEDGKDYIHLRKKEVIILAYNLLKWVRDRLESDIKYFEEKEESLADMLKSEKFILNRIDILKRIYFDWK